MIYISLVVLLTLLVLGNVFTYPLQHLFIFRPEALDTKHRFEFDQHFEELNLKTADGGNINALHFKSDSAKGVILYFHGNAGNLDRWGRLSPAFERRDYDLFVMDFRGFGKSTGKQSEALFYQDARQCYDYLAAHYPPEQIIIYGRSMGSGPASYLASEVAAKHLILETPFYSIKNLFFTYYPFLPPVFVFRFRFPNYKYLQAVRYPITIFHGTEDFIVPYRGAKKLKAVLKPTDDFITIEGGSHGDLSAYDEYQKGLSRILE